MSSELEFLSRYVAKGKLSRRDFLGRAAALGVTATFANSLLSSAVRAEGPVKGGVIKAGLVGGESTNSLDPALMMTQVPFAFGKCWGEMIVELSPEGKLENRIAEEIGSSDDAKVWTLKIRDGVEFHNGKTVTAEDVAATLERHSDEKSKSGALGYMKGIESIKASGKEVVLTLKEANADLPYLLSDYHLIVQPNGGKDEPDAGIRRWPVQDRYQRARRAPWRRALRQLLAGRQDGPCRPGRDHRHQRRDGAHFGPAGRPGQHDQPRRAEDRRPDQERLPGVTIRNHAGPGHYVFIMHCNTAPFDNNDLRMALKLAMDREEMLDKILRGYGSLGNDFPINASYPLFSDDRAAQVRSRQGQVPLQEVGPRRHRCCCAPRTSPSRVPSTRPSSIQQSAAKAGIKIEVKREPGDGYWNEVWNKQPFSDLLLGRPLDPGPDVLDRLSSRRPTGTTRASCVRTSTRWCWRPAPNSTRPSASRCTATWPSWCATKAA